LQLQTEIALSSTESEFIGLSTALRTTIPIMELVKELKSQGYDMVSTQPTVHCRIFEDNSGTLEIAKGPKMRPRTKHINVKFHHFRDYIDHGEITLHAIGTTDQPANMLTKPLAEPILRQHHHTIMGWGGRGNAERECEDSIFVVFSNAMNLQEIIPVPSLRIDMVPGLHTRSHSASPNLQR